MNISVILDDFTNASKEFLMASINVNEAISVFEFKQLYKKSDDIDIHFIYRGELANDSSSLKELGIKNGSCVKLLFSKSAPKFTLDNIDRSINEIMKKHKEIMKMKSKDMINKIIVKEIDNIIETHPELEKDLVAYSIAFDYHLLRTLFSSRENVTRILEKHPVLIPAALKTVNIIHEKIKHLTPLSTKTPKNDARYFSLQEVEQSDSSSGDEQPSTSSQSYSPRTESISRSQLRQAIGLLTNSSNVPNSLSAPLPSLPLLSGPLPPPLTQSRISLSQLRTAVQTALQEQGEPMEVDDIPTGALSVQDSDSLEEKLAQLHSMGFMDNAANKIALEVTGGDVEAAIEYLIL